MDLGWIAVSHVLHTTGRRRTLIGVFGWLLCGLALGGISVAIHPAHFFHTKKMRLAILVVAPLVAGTVMHLYGRVRGRRGRMRSSLATFAGGTTFALGIHLVRYFWR